MRLVIDEAAWHDLEKIGVWIARESGVQAARRTLQTISSAIALIQKFPRLARRGRAKGTFEKFVPHSSYIIVYEWYEKPEAIVVTGIIHTARNR